MSDIKPVKSILISQPAPSDENSPYFKLARKWDIQVDFRKFIAVEGVSLNEFRKQGINPLDFTAVIFTSKVAVDHFFSLLEEMRVEMPPETKYFCVSESTSKYLQKYITIRKRKLFVGERRAMDLLPFIQKHKKETFLFPCSDVHRRELPGVMIEQGMKLTESVIYRTVHADLSDLENIFYDMICFFSPSGIQSLFSNFPDFKQNDTRIAVFGPTTSKEAVNSGLVVNVEAPKPNMPSMTSAIEKYLAEIGQKSTLEA
ncbi:uroporphyrinogen-III synthase [Pontibacter sp. G13]|uniref:uroporphyrinogen-III synthase n=1 Tax=Pontibacter sp. G13 TaxID=3074898 RepID=UPI002889174A|nr:uroporphyrinogen-III synthase [Pontibacter sp. G13]WNJ16239.1 uroporphyrinogen-III synthase [Pontibacter sp. G13]